MKRFTYNPVSDLHCVDPLSAGIDLRSAYVNGVVPGNVSAVDMDYNDVEEPSSMMNHPSDPFEAMRQSDYVKGVVSAKKAEAKLEASSSAEN